MGIGSFGSVARRFADFGGGIVAGAQQQRQAERAESGAALQTALALGAQGIDVSKIPGFEDTLFTESGPRAISAFKNVASSGAFTKPYEAEQRRRGRAEGLAALQTNLALARDGIKPGDVPGLNEFMFADADSATRASVAAMAGSPALMKPYDAAQRRLARTEGREAFQTQVTLAAAGIKPGDVPGLNEFMFADADPATREAIIKAGGSPALMAPYKATQQAKLDELELKWGELDIGRERNRIYGAQVAATERRNDALMGLNTETKLGTSSTERRQELGSFAAQTIRSMALLPDEAWKTEKDDKGRARVVPSSEAYENITNKLIFGALAYVDERGVTDPVQARGAMREYIRQAKITAAQKGTMFGAGSEPPSVTLPDPAAVDKVTGFTVTPGRAAPPRLNPGTTQRPTATDYGSSRLGGMSDAPALDDLIAYANRKIAAITSTGARGRRRQIIAETLAEAFPDVPPDYLNSKLAR